MLNLAVGGLLPVPAPPLLARVNFELLLSQKIDLCALAMQSLHAACVAVHVASSHSQRGYQPRESVAENKQSAIYRLMGGEPKSAQEV